MREVDEPAPANVRAIKGSFKPLLIPPATLAASGLSDGELLNPSICTHNGQLKAIVRVISHAATYNFLGTVTDTWELSGAREMKNMTGCKGPYGLEDCRLFSRSGSLHVSATMLETHAAIVIAKVSETGDFVDGHTQHSPGRHEKNWMPIIVDGDLWFIYSTEPAVRIVRYNDTDKSVSPNPSTFTPQATYLRGGSQLQVFEDGYLAVVHQVHRQPSIYLHRLVFFDRFLRVKKMSEPFYFREKGIEFCAGLARWQGCWVMSVGVADKQAWLAIVTTDTITEMLT